MTTKMCSKCEQEFPATTEYFHSDGNNKLYRMCKSCRSKYRTELRLANLEAVKEKEREYRKRYRAENLEKVREKERIYKSTAEQKEKKREYDKQYREKNKEIIREKKRQYREANKDVIKERKRQERERNREQTLARKKRYYMENKARHKMKKAEYRARLLEAEGTHTAEDIRYIYEEQEGRCAYCGITLYDDYAVDHVVPLSRGGTNWPDNLAVTCMFCNQSKHDRLLSEWGLFNKHDVWPLANLDGYYIPIAEGIEGET